MNEAPSQIKQAKALRKPEKLPDNANNIILSDETTKFLEKLPVYAVDGEYLYQEEFPTKSQYYILWDYTTNLAWLADSAGFRYPRYVININPWRPEEFLSRPENLPESVYLEMTSSMSMGTAPMVATKRKKKKVDTTYKWKKLTQSSKLISSLLEQANICMRARSLS
jgi:hypothetical protein